MLTRISSVGYRAHDLRARRVPGFIGGCLLILALTLTAPPRAPVLFQDITADPWRTLWALPACFVAGCLDPSHDYMEQALPRPLWTRRATTLAVCVTVATMTVLVSAALLRKEATGALTGLFLMIAMCLLLATQLSPAVAGVTVFTFILANWIFGLDEITLQAHPWALLMSQANPALLMAASAILLVGTAVWSHRGSAR